MNLSFILVVFLNDAIMCFDINFIDLENYLDNEGKVISVFNNYLVAEEKRLRELRQFYDKLVENKTNSAFKKQFLRHPIDIYILVKNLVTEWRRIVEALESNQRRHRKLVKGLRDQVLDQFKLEGKQQCVLKLIH